MQVNAENVQGVTVITPPELVLDAHSANDFKREVSHVLRNSPLAVLDMGNISFIDSSGLGVLLSCLRQCTAAGGTLKLCGVSQQVSVIFQMVRMARLFEIFGDRSSALESFQ